ncbi:dual specificity phosphatase [Cryptosporidium canis]|nr:dual specificity phosphatase [Cryptosporidium canis]
MLTNDRLDVIKKYRTICSEIIEGRLYLGGYQLACDWERLQEKRITHIINVSGDTCKNAFEDRLEYRTYYILDTPQESIEGVLYDSIEWIDTKLRMSESRIYVHCQEGVSRSSSLVIGYLMWKNQMSFSEASDYVRERRSTSSPNIGFTYQLLLFQKALGFARPGTRVLREGETAELPSVSHLGKRHWVISQKLYYLSEHGIPASLINWRGDGSHHFNLNSSKIYLLRQSLLEDSASSARRERLWIWVGSQAKEGLRRSILGVLRFCRQILEIEMGHHSSLELDNLDIRADLVIGALEGSRNSPQDHLTNILSSTIILEYFHEFSESGEFMRVLAPNQLHACSCDIVQRSYSSPSIKSVSRGALPGGSEESDGGLEGEDLGSGGCGDGCRYRDSGLGSESSSEISSLMSLDESLPYFSSFPSSNGSPAHSRNSPVSTRGQNPDFEEATGRAVSRANLHHFSLDSQQINYTREHLLGEGGDAKTSCPGLGRVVVPKLNFAFKTDGHSEEGQRTGPDTKSRTQTSPKQPAQGKSHRSIHFNENEVFCHNSNSYSKRSSVSQESLSASEDCCSSLEGRGAKVLLFRFPDYFGSESLRFFDSEDLLPGSVCPLVIIDEALSEQQGEEAAGPPGPPAPPDVGLRSVVIYLWIGSKTIYFSQAKKILSEHPCPEESHHSHVDIGPLILQRDLASSKSLDHNSKPRELAGQLEPDISQLVILLIRNNSRLSLKDVHSVYFEFEGEESNTFWNYFYL